MCHLRTGRNRGRCVGCAAGQRRDDRRGAAGPGTRVGRASAAPRRRFLVPASANASIAALEASPVLARAKPSAAPCTGLQIGPGSLRRYPVLVTSPGVGANCRLPQPAGPILKENEMAVARITEISSVSAVSFQDAIATGSNAPTRR